MKKSDIESELHIAHNMLANARSQYTNLSTFLPSGHAKISAAQEEIKECEQDVAYLENQLSKYA